MKDELKSSMPVSANQLKRTIGLPAAVAITVGFIVGGAIYVLMPTLAGLTGPSLWLAYLCAILPPVFAALYLIQMAGAIPVTGASFIATTKWVSPKLGFSLSFITVLGMVSGTCLVAFGAAQYLQIFFPSLPLVLTTIIILVVFGILNVIGIKSMAIIQTIMFVVLVLSMLIYGLGGLPTIEAANMTPMFSGGLVGFLMAVALGTYSWAGITAITEFSGEIKKPRKTIPLTIGISLGIIAIMYVSIALSFTGNLNFQQAAEIGSTAVIVAAGNFLPQWLVSFIVIGALMAMLTTVNGMILISTREMLAWARQKTVPAIFGKLNKKFKTPVFNIGLFTILAILGVIVAATLDKYALISVFAVMFAQFLGALSMLRMPKKSPEVFEKSKFKFKPFWRWFTFIGCTLLSLLIFLFAFLTDYITGIIFVGVFILGIIYYYIRKAYLKKRSINLDDELKNMSQDSLDELSTAD